MPWPLPGAFFLTDPKRIPDPVKIVETLPPGTGIIYRHFGAEDRFDIATKLRKTCFKYGFPLLIANDPELAIRIRADGVHWPEANAAAARKWRGRFLIQTQSVHSASGMNNSVCDAVLFSTVFTSNSPSAGKAMGATRFRRLILKSDRLVYALGGVNASTAEQISGFTGFAAIEGFL